MKISRLSILLLFTTMLIPIGASAHCKGKHIDYKPHCDVEPPDTGDSITHVANLTGAFAFDTVNNSVDVTANNKGTELRSAKPVKLTKPTDSALEAIWNNVFEQCPDFFGATMVDVPSFTAPADGKGWTINKEGGVSVAFRKIPFTVSNSKVQGDVEVNLYLNGTTPYANDFLPVDPSPGTSETITHILSRFAIWGQTAKGGTPGGKCGGDTRGGTFPMGRELALTITATAPPTS